MRQAVDQWFPRYMQDLYQVDLKSARFQFLAFLIPLVASAGSLLAGYVSDTLFKGRRAPVAAVLYFLETTVILLAAQFHTANAAILFLVLISFTANSTHSILGMAAPMDIGGRRMAGFALGLIDSFQYFGGSLAGYFLGNLLDRSLGNYFYFMAPFGVVGGLLMLFIRGKITHGPSRRSIVRRLPPSLAKQWNVPRSYRAPAQTTKLSEPRTFRVDSVPSTAPREKYQERSEQNHKQDDHEEDEAVARHAFLIAQRPQSLDPARRQVAHQLRVGRGRPPKMAPEAPQQGEQVVFSHAQLIIVLRGGACLAPPLQQVMADFLEDRLMVRRCGRRRRLGCRMTDRAAVRQRSGPQTRLGLIALQARVELLDL